MNLKVCIDKGHYNLDCHVPSSLLKLWSRELEESHPEELPRSGLDPERAIDIVKSSPTINERALFFVTSLLELYLQENIRTITKLNSVNLACACHGPMQLRPSPQIPSASEVIFTGHVSSSARILGARRHDCLR